MERVGIFLWNNDRVLLIARRARGNKIIFLPVCVMKKNQTGREAARECLKRCVGLDARPEDFFLLPRRYEIRHSVLYCYSAAAAKCAGVLRPGAAWIKLEQLCGRDLDPLAERVIKDIFGVSKKSKYRLD